MKKQIFALGLALAALLLTAVGCQPAPEASVVVSKNDGVFEAALEEAADGAADTADGAEEEAEAEEIVAEAEMYTSTFTSTDGSVTYIVEAEVPVASAALPVIQVTSHSITSEEAERVARALFGDADIYAYTTELSKVEIEENILALRQHISDWDALVEYYSGDEALAKEVQEDYEARIATLEALYADASETVEPVLCDWVLHTEDYYDNPSWGIYSEADDRISELKAITWIDGVSYSYGVYNRNAEDYRIHYISAWLDESLSAVERYSLQEPTEEEIQDATSQAEAILADMDMGEWVVDSCEIRSWEDWETGVTVYEIVLTACPVYNGVKVTDVGVLASVKSDDAYAANYDYERITMDFGGGRLLSFDYDSPLEVVEVVNSNVKTLSFDEITEIFETQMSLTDASYSWGAVTADIDVSHIEFGLSRIRIKDNLTDFYLVPTYAFYGKATNYDESGNPIIWYDSNGAVFEMETEDLLLVVNAVDGTIINTLLGY